MSKMMEKLMNKEKRQKNLTRQTRTGKTKKGSEI